MLDEIEFGLENEEPATWYTAIVQPPLGGDVSDEEDGDEEIPNVNNLPAKLLRAPV